MSTEVPFSRQFGPEDRLSIAMAAETAPKILKRNVSVTLILHIPGGVTNTSGTSVLPTGLMSVALYVPTVAAVAVMVRVKLKKVVPGDAFEQGLPIW